MKNPWMSMWLSAANKAANTAAGGARGAWTAEAKRQQTAFTKQMSQEVVKAWGLAPKARKKGSG